MQQVMRQPEGEIGISTVTLSELEYGARRSQRPAANRWALVSFMAGFETLDYDDTAAAEYGRIRMELESAGTPIGPLDIMIAAHALACRRVLVSNSEREFRRVDSLEVANWVL